MDSATWLPLATAALVVVAAVVLSAVVIVSGRTGRRRLERALHDSRAELDLLRSRVDELFAQVGDDGDHERPVSRQFVITSLPDGSLNTDLAERDEDHPTAARQLSAGQFASVAFGESLVRLLSLGHGVGRALSPESRNRIRFAVRQEVRRARRQRRRDLKEARRHLREQQARDDGVDLSPHAADRDADAA